MAIRRGRRHEVTIDGQTVWLDSMNEETALKRFIDQYGFSSRWERPTAGIKHGHRYYTPDFELAVSDGAHTHRAIVEIKEYRRDCVKDIRERMAIIAEHYNTNHIYLYATKKDAWFRMDRKSIRFESCAPPLPGVLDLSKLVKPLRFSMRNYYGRRYTQSFSDSFLSALFPPKPKRRRRRSIF